MSGFMKKGAFPTTPVQEELYKAANKVFSLEMQLMDAKHAAKKLQPPPPDVAANHRKFMGHALRVTVDCLDDGLITFIPAGTVGYYEASEYQDDQRLLVALTYGEDETAWIDARYLEVFD